MADITSIGPVSVSYNGPATSYNFQQTADTRVVRTDAHQTQNNFDSATGRNEAALITQIGKQTDSTIGLLTFTNDTGNVLQGVTWASITDAATGTTANIGHSMAISTWASENPVVSINGVSYQDYTLSSVSTITGGNTRGSVTTMFGGGSTQLIWLYTAPTYHAEMGTVTTVVNP